MLIYRETHLDMFDSKSVQRAEQTLSGCKQVVYIQTAEFRLQTGT